MIAENIKETMLQRVTMGRSLPIGKQIPFFVPVQAKQSILCYNYKQELKLFP